MVRHSRSALRGLLGAGVFLFLFATAAPTPAQRSSAPPSGTNGPFADSMERRSRENALRSLKPPPREKDPGNPVSPEMARQMSEDFKRIQVIRLGMVEGLKANRTFEPKRLADEAAEIKKRAARLKASLALFEPQQGDKQTPGGAEFGEEGLRDAVFNLCLEISKFIENPLFRSAGAYNARQAVEAGRALDEIIRLSGAISAGAGKLRRAGK